MESGARLPNLDALAIDEWINENYRGFYSFVSEFV